MTRLEKAIVACNEESVWRWRPVHEGGTEGVEGTGAQWKDMTDAERLGYMAKPPGPMPGYHAEIEAELDALLHRAG